MTLRNFFRGKKILITGHTGFKGAWLSIWLSEMGAKVTGYSLDVPTRPSLYKAAKVAELIHSIKGDVRHFSHFNRVIQKVKPQIIFHMAAQALVRVSYDQPQETFDTNVNGTVNLFESLRKKPFKTAVIIVTSDKCYLNDGRKGGYQEFDALGGCDPYSASKAAAEIVTTTYRESFFKDSVVRIASARAGNVIGGGDWASDRIFPDIARSISRNKPIAIRNPRFVRPWQHVLEPLSGYLALAQAVASGKSKYQSSWNFGPADRDSVSVKKLVEAALSDWGAGLARYPKQTTQKKEAFWLKLNCAKAKRDLKWKSKMHWNEAIKVTVYWYKQYMKNPSLARKLCQEQIKEFSR